ncbi:MAG: hypothetical protein U5O16_00125 [Rhodococcus sp. (in: high G+C Gram-positive bacteria)]|uniref:hypothetical protein n=1 Tax=Rhodococcus sp. TaxID=1831 RepID=UPI002ADD28E7|nr:hypothetical protein [Rhodococcus sp. (in: high G+C Gram-positive bacteria)]
MLHRRQYVGVGLVSLSCAVAAGCGIGGHDNAGETVVGYSREATATTPALDTLTSAESTDPVQIEVTVTQPALIDTNARAADLPIWPGPDPAEFLAPNPPAGDIGHLTGVQARDVVAAAHTNPGELWNVNGVVLWLVVT